MTTVSARINDDLVQKLDLLSKATSRSRSFLVSEAIIAYIEDQIWQIDAIKKGLDQADKGDYASDKEVDDFFAQF
ncbi:MAG: ribbon-helix-helix domain-containing protein [Desulfobacteraceae bacterium]|jgi:predicted transcriptional regulator